MPGLERWLQGSIIVHQPKVCNSKSQQNVIAWFEGLSFNRDTLCQLPSQQKITDIERPHPAARNDSGFSFCKHLISISASLDRRIYESTSKHSRTTAPAKTFPHRDVRSFCVVLFVPSLLVSLTISIIKTCTQIMQNFHSNYINHTFLVLKIIFKFL